MLTELSLNLTLFSGDQKQWHTCLIVVLAGAFSYAPLKGFREVRRCLFV
jgi:hypothetical protein